MRHKLGLKVLLALVILFSFILPAFANANSVEDSVYDTVYYYKNNNTALSSWEEVIGLRGAGEDLSAAPWQLPDWKVDELSGTSSALEYASTILGMLAAGQNPSDVDGRNLIKELADKQLADGGFGGALNQTIWSLIALDTAKSNYAVNNAVAYLLDQQKSDGGFALSGTTGDPDMTGFALIALASHTDFEGVDAAISKAQVFLQSIQLKSGGFKSGTTENAESIAAVIRGLIACGVDITSDAWKKNDQTMIDALFAFKLADGSLSHTIGGSSNSIATRQALIALADLVNGNVFYNIREGNTPPPGPVQEATVRVRVEGASASLTDKTVTVSGTAMDALKAAVGEENLQAPGWFITQIMGECGQTGVAENTDTGWCYYVIRDAAIELSAFDQGASSYNVEDGDQIIFYIGALDNKTYASKTYLPVISVSPEKPTAGQTVSLTISAKKYVWGSGLVNLTAEEAAAAGNYTVKAGGNDYTSANGQVSIPNVSAGTLSVRIENYNQTGYPNIVPLVMSLTVVPEDNGSEDNGSNDTLKISIKVRDKDKEIIYSGSVTLNKDEPNDPIYALQQTPLDVEVKYDGQYVYSIEGIAEDSGSTAGWKYKVNGIAPPSTSAGDYELEDGDELEWFWAADASDNGDSDTVAPETPSIPEIPAEREKAAQQASEKALEELNNLAENAIASLAQQAELYDIVELTGKKAVVVGSENPMTAQEQEEWEKAIKENNVSLSQRITSNSSCDVKDQAGEICLSLEKGALGRDITIQVQEQNSSDLPAPETHRIVSSIYNFGPDGTHFAKPAILKIKLPIDYSAGKDLILAWFNTQNQEWVPVPTVIDAANGEIMGLVNHFTKFAALEREQEYTSFTDIGASAYEWAKKEIDYLAVKGIVSGTDAGLFSPDQPVTRAEFVTMLARALELNLKADYQINFSDVKKTNWYAEPINAAVKDGLIKGFADNIFRPGDIITREQIAAILTRVLKLKPSNDLPEFADQAKLSPWAREAVQTAVGNQLIEGYPDGTFRPDQSATRAQSAVLIYRMLKLL